MSRLTKIMFGLMMVNGVASALFLTGVVDVSSVPGFYVVFPLTTVFYGMFLICRMLQKDVAAFDAEQRASHDRAAPEEHPRNVDFLHNHERPESIAA
jgi:hypothetical protein